MYDVIVIGGGPAGVMAALQALKRNKKILLIDKNKEIGTKLRLTGGGRCNVTNSKPNNQLISQVHNGQFLFSSLSNFNYYDIVSLFNQYGVELKEEDNGRVFPITDNSLDIINALKNALNSYENFYTAFSEDVKDVLQENQVVTTVITNKNTYNTKSVILAAGGASLARTGSDGSGFLIAEHLGHKIVPIYPTQTPLVSEEDFIQDKSLQGTSVKNVGIKTKTFKETGFDLIFTHFGLSGPAILRASKDVYFELKNNSVVDLYIDFFPNLDQQELFDQIISLLKDNPKKTVKNALHKLTQTKLLNLLIKKAQIYSNETCATIANKKITNLVNLIKNFKVQISSVKGFNSAYVTGGGVNLKQVDPKTMRSKLIKNLYFAGEVLDLHANTGGYNITVALSTGYTAGNNC
jgi:predicted Rossmann fold flavoprotein